MENNTSDIPSDQSLKFFCLDSKGEKRLKPFYLNLLELAAASKNSVSTLVSKYDISISEDGQKRRVGKMLKSVVKMRYYPTIEIREKINQAALEAGITNDSLSDGNLDSQNLEE